MTVECFTYVTATTSRVIANSFAALQRPSSAGAAGAAAAQVSNCDVICVMSAGYCREQSSGVESKIRVYLTLI